jgi:exodeoxyribonuclease-3
MRIVSWNINSVRLRMPIVAQLTETVKPDVLCLQETKATDDVFPREALAALGYEHMRFRGMKGYNGVAILSRLPLGDGGSRDWCGKEDARHVAAKLPGGIELHNFYIPSGGDEPDPAVNDKFAHKLDFLCELATWWRDHRDDKAKRIMVGDFNIAPLETDVWSHKQLLKIVSHTPIEVEHLDKVQSAHDWVDAIRHFVPEEEKIYSWWSYRSRDWAASDRGRRLDHIWVTQALKPALKSGAILREARGWEKPSDHVPVIVDLEP